MVKNYYEEFGIPENASLREIKRAYRKLVIKYHPDRNNSDIKFEIIFKRINNIYQILSDPSRKREYDDELRRNREATPQPSAYHSSNESRPRQAYRTGNTQSSGINRAIWFGFWLIFMVLKSIMHNGPSNNANTSSFVQSSYYTPRGLNFRTDSPSVGDRLFGDLNSVILSRTDSSDLNGSIVSDRKVKRNK